MIEALVLPPNWAAAAAAHALGELEHDDVAETSHDAALEEEVCILL
jgi:hypothetical protein